MRSKEELIKAVLESNIDPDLKAAIIQEMYSTYPVYIQQIPSLPEPPYYTTC